MAEISGGSIHFEATLGHGELDKAVNESKVKILEMGSAGAESAQAMDAAFDKLAGTLGRLLGVAGAAGFVKKMFSVRSEMENTEASFKVFLGTAEAASDFMNKLKDAAYWNVFEFKDLAKQSAQLLAYKTNVEDVIPTLNKLSEIAAGTNAPLESLVAVFNKVKASDKMDAVTAMSLGNMGIDIYQELADIKTAETGMQVLRSEVQGTTLGFADLQKVIDKVATGEGMFAGMMEEKMSTLGDTLGLMEDNVTNMFNELGESTHGVMKSAMDVGNYLLENYEEVGRSLATLVAMYGEYKAALIATKAINNEETGVKFIDNLLRECEAMEQKKQLEEEIAIQEAAEKARKQDEIRDLEELISLNDQELSRAKEVYEAKLSNASAVDANTNAEEANTRIEELKAASEKMNALATEGASLAERKAALSAQLEGTEASKATIKVKLHTAAQKAATTATNLLKGAFNKLKTAMASNPFGIALVALTAVVSIVSKLIRKHKEQREEQQQVTESYREFTKEVEQENNKLNAIEVALNGATQGTDAHRAAIKSLNEMCKQYNLTLINENASLEEQKAKYKELRTAIKSAAAEKTKSALESNILTKKEEAYTEAQNDLANSRFFKKGDRNNALAFAQTSMSLYADDIASGKTKTSDVAMQIMKEIEANTGEKLLTKGNFNGKVIDVANGKEAQKLYMNITSALNKMSKASKEADVEMQGVNKTYNNFIASGEEGEIVMQSNAEKIASWKEALATVQAELKEKTAAGYEWAVGEDAGKVVDDLREQEKNLIDNITKLGGQASALGSKTKSGSGSKSANSEEKTLQQENENRIMIEKQGYEQEDALDALRWEEKKNEIRKRLKTESGLTEKERESLNNQLSQLDELQGQESEKKARERYERQVALDREYEQQQIDLMEDGLDKQMRSIELSYNRTLDSITSSENTGEIDSAEADRQRRQALEKRNKEEADALEDAIGQYKGYLDKRKELEDEYKSKESGLYTTDANGNQVLREGVTQDVVDNLSQERDNALAELDEQFASKSAEYKRWAAQVESMTISNIRSLLEKAKEELLALENDPDTDPQKLANARAKVNLLEDKIDGADLSPEKEASENWEEFTSAIDAAGNALNELGESMDNSVGEVLSGMGSILTDASSAINAITNLSKTSITGVEAAATAGSAAIKAVETASVVLAVISTIISIINKVRQLIVKIQEKNAEEQERQHEKYLSSLEAKLESLQYQYDKLGEKISNAFGASKQDLIKQQIENLEAQREVLKEQINDAVKNGDIYKVTELLRSYADIQDKIDGLNEDLADVMFGSSITSQISEIGDALVDAFVNGENAAEAFADSATSWTKQAISNIVKDYISQMGYVENIRAKIAEAYADGTITEEEMDAIKQYAKEQGEQAKRDLGWVSELSDSLDGSSSTSSTSGAIKTITEESASLIAGQMNAIRVNQVTTMQTQEAIRSTLMGIKGDTAYLREIYNRVNQLVDVQVYTNRINS